MGKVVLRIGRKGILILPKRLREGLGVGEGDELLAEASGGGIVLKPLKPRIVRIDHELAREILSEEAELEDEKHRRLTAPLRRRL
ncbi:MAG: AbrB/MazE/SpoVT family DNA-binding domain-containing protein [Candidatus Bathyarchaeia archaeon]